MLRLQRRTRAAHPRGAVMSAPTLDRRPGSSQTGSSDGRRRNRKLVLVASALIVLAVAFGTSLAIATRPVARQDPAATTPVAAPEDQSANQRPNANQDTGQAPTGDAGISGGTGSGTEGQGTGTAAPVLPEGTTSAYITKVASDRVMVDVVQVFHDDQAVKAAIADGTSPAKARYYTGWVRNENPRLRTVPLAANLDVKLLGGCEDTGDRAAVLTQLADHAKRKGSYYFDLTVASGKVTRIQERLAANAC
jgi:hypothetical protein